jgi:hypothetical protein
MAGMAEGFRRFLSAWPEWRITADEYRELNGEDGLVSSTTARWARPAD